ncbi:glycerol-3-phosphate acyltransferase, partial [Tepidiforma sp.]|uniref:glycerol-3-phosphate acyltransferase n=1 Tax=Tepidiforma sp. TaxID=2682230 RepID=UPI002ADD5F6C
MAVAAGYAAGSLPFAAWAARARGGDVRTSGDGNPGATNAWAAGGPAAGVAAAIGDWAKGALPVALALRAGTRGPA